MTGGSDIETAIQAVELGALRYLVKPIAAEALQEAVDKAVLLNRLDSAVDRLRGVQAEDLIGR